MGIIKTHTAKAAMSTVKKAVPAVMQHDSDSCGWATTLWLLKKFGRLDVTQKQLREELNTDARKGVRGWWNNTVATLAGKAGWDLELPKGTLPKAIYDALSKRGVTIKNPIRAEKFSEYVDYLNDTFNAGGQAAILLFGLNGFMHWMGIERASRRGFRLMDPLAGYQPFASQLAYYRKTYNAKYFLVFGFVPKDNPPQLPHAKNNGNAKRANAAKGEATKPSLRDRIYTSFEQMTDAYNEVRDDLIELGILWRGSKLDKVQCFYEPIAPYRQTCARHRFRQLGVRLRHAIRYRFHPRGLCRNLHALREAQGQAPRAVQGKTRDREEVEGRGGDCEASSCGD